MCLRHGIMALGQRGSLVSIVFWEEESYKVRHWCKLDNLSQYLAGCTSMFFLHFSEFQQPSFAFLPPTLSTALLSKEFFTPGCFDKSSYDISKVTVEVALESNHWQPLTSSESIYHWKTTIKNVSLKQTGVEALSYYCYFYEWVQGCSFVCGSVFRLLDNRTSITRIPLIESLHVYTSLTKR